MKPGFAYTAESINPTARPLPEGKRPWKALGMLRRLDFNSTPGYYFDSALLEDNDPVLEGRMRMMQLQPGLSIHGTEVVDLHNMVSRVRIKAGLRIVITLAGEIDVHIGGQRVQVHALRETAVSHSSKRRGVFISSNLKGTLFTICG